ncbi:MAG: hypothetical protein M5U34_07265 [Chloroflexi bacterium]|nr:hypothetical protein [Chloroflexota bacterium]
MVGKGTLQHLAVFCLFRMGIVSFGVRVSIGLIPNVPISAVLCIVTHPETVFLMGFVRSSIPLCQPTRVHIRPRRIPHIPIQIRIARRKPGRIFGQPSADIWIVPSVEVPLQPGVVVEVAGGVAEDGVDRRGGLGIDLSEGLVDLVVGDRGHVGRGVVGRHVADGALPIRQRPEDVLRPAIVDRLVGQDLVDGRTPEVAVGEVGGRRAVEVEDGIVAVVGPEGVGGRSGPGAVGVEFLMDEAVVDVLLIGDGYG